MEWEDSKLDLMDGTKMSVSVPLSDVLSNDVVSFNYTEYPARHPRMPLSYQWNAREA